MLNSGLTSSSIIGFGVASILILGPILISIIAGFRAAWEWAIFIVLRHRGNWTQADVKRLFVRRIGRNTFFYVEYAYFSVSRNAYFLRQQRIERQHYNLWKDNKTVSIKILESNPNISRLTNESLQRGWVTGLALIAPIFTTYFFGPTTIVAFLIGWLLVFSISVWRLRKQAFD